MARVAFGIASLLVSINTLKKPFSPYTLHPLLALLSVALTHEAIMDLQLLPVLGSREVCALFSPIPIMLR